MKVSYVTVLLPLSAFLVAGCGNVFPKDDLKKDNTPVYRVAFNQVPQEPVYNRVKKVYLPSVLPPSTLSQPEGKQVALQQIYDLDLKNVTVEKAAVALAAVGGYDHYTASTVADKPLTLKALGTLDELGEAVGKASGTHVVVDHTNRQVRIVAKAAE